MSNPINRWTAARRVSIALLAMAVLWTVAMPAGAVPANGKVWTFTQPDGHQFQAILRGDEFHAYHETPTGEILLQEPTTGVWHYAKPHADGTLEDTNIVVGQSAPETAALNPEKIPYLRAVQAMVSAKMAERRLELGPARVPAHGSLKALILLANFSDTAPTFPQSVFSSLMNDPGYNANGAHGSVRDYYLEVSYGQLTIHTDVYGWFNLPHPRAYYGANVSGQGDDIRPREMIQDTITASEATVNYSQYDSDGDGWVDFFGVIHQGQGEEQSGAPADCIWSHSWELASPMTVNGVKIQHYHTEPEMFYTSLSTIGVNCHEMGHVFGLPDEYDTGYNSSGVGMWSIMAGGSWAGPNGGDGSKPVHFDPWCKVGLGWITPTVVTSIQAAAALPSFYNNPNSVLRIPVDPYNDGEYFLVANRYAHGTGLPATGFDQYCPGSGALVLHVDDYVPDNDNAAHKKVDVEEADGLARLDITPGYPNWSQGDATNLYPIGGTTFNGTSNPNSRDYAGNLTGISLTNFTGAGTANMTVAVTPRSSTGASIVYDEMGAMGDSDGYNDGGDDFGLVRFTAPENGTIKRIKTFFVYAGTTNYTVKIYSGLSAGVPTGLLASQSSAHAGNSYGSLTLTTPLAVTAGEDFYVEIEYNTGGGYGWPIPMTRDTTPEERSYERTSASVPYTQLLVPNGDTSDINIRVDYLPVAVTQPAVANAPASSVTNSAATLNGNLTATGGENPTVHIYWGTTDGGTTAANWANDVNLGALAAGAFSTNISGLNAGSTYYYTAYAANSAGGVWASSSTSLVTDSSVTAPAVSNDPVTNLTATAATLNGAVTGLGGENPTVHIYWGLTDGGTTAGNWANDANLGTRGLGAFSTDISSLATSATYYYRAYAANSGGSAWAAASDSFLTRDLVPAVVANAPATSVTRTTAVLNGVVTDDGGVTPVITIFYGTGDGGTTPGAWTSSVDVGPVAGGTFSAPVTGLTAETTYYYCVRAVNSVGTSWASASMSFTTALNPLAIPSGLSAGKGTSSAQVSVSWSAVPEATYYKVYRASSATGTPQELTGWIAATTYDDTSMTLGDVEYYWVMAARGPAGDDATDLSSSDYGWLAMTGPAANFRISYKNCTVAIDHNSLVRVSASMLASVKIDKLKKMPSRAISIPGKVAYIVGIAGIPRMDITGNVVKFSTSAPIGVLNSTGTIASLSTVGVSIPTITANVTGSIKMGVSSPIPGVSRPVTSIALPAAALAGAQRATSGAPALKVSLTGVSLNGFAETNEGAAIKVSAKKTKGGTIPADVTAGAQILVGDGLSLGMTGGSIFADLIESQGAITLAVKGGNIGPDPTTLTSATLATLDDTLTSPTVAVLAHPSTPVVVALSGGFGSISGDSVDGVYVAGANVVNGLIHPTCANAVQTWNVTDASGDAFVSAAAATQPAGIAAHTTAP